MCVITRNADLQVKQKIHNTTLQYIKYAEREMGSTIEINPANRNRCHQPSVLNMKMRTIM